MILKKGENQIFVMLHSSLNPEKWGTDLHVTGPSTSHYSGGKSGVTALGSFAPLVKQCHKPLYYT